MRLTIVFIALTIACATAIQTSNQGKMTLESTMKQLQSSKWGKVAAQFLELSTSVGSPVGDLMQAFQDFYRDMGFKHEIENFDFTTKEVEHDAWEAAIRTRIADAEQDIAVSTHTLVNILYPLKADLEDRIARDEQLIVDTNNAMDAATAARVAENAAYLQWMDEATRAVAALNECLELIAGLGEGATLIQTTKLNHTFKKLEKSIKNTKWGKTIVALIRLAEKDVNPAMLTKLIGKFTEVRNSMTQGMDDATGAEADAADCYQNFIFVCTNTIMEAEARLTQNRAALVTCIQDIADTEAFRAQREADLAVAEDDLADELARWANEVALFNTMMEEMGAEMQAISDVLDVFAGMNISEETYTRLNN